MPVFEYTGVDASSKTVKGVVDAESEKAARAKLRKMRVFPTKISLEGQRSLKSVGFSKNVSIEEVAQMTRQLAVMLGASIPLIDALAGVQDQVENQIIRSALAEIKEKVSEGARLGDCMTAYPKVFDNIYIYMVKAGEVSGSLDVVFARLAEFKEASAALKSKIKSAMTYPVIMVLVSVGVLGFIFTSVIPKIAKIFEKQDAALPTATQIVIAITHMIQDYWLLMILMAAGGFIMIRTWSKTASGREKIDSVMLRAPIFGELNRKVAVARLSRTLSTLLNSGVQLLPALDIVKNVMDNVVLERIIDTTMVSVKEGESFAEPLRRSKQFPTLFIQMITVGEKTGQLEGMLERVADTFDGEVDSYIERMTSMMTPLMLVFMGGAIGFIVFAVMMPILPLTQMQ